MKNLSTIDAKTTIDATSLMEAQTLSDVAAIAQDLSKRYAKALRRKHDFNTADLHDIARRCQLRFPAFSCT